MSGLSKYLLSAQMSSRVQSWEWEKESRRGCIILPGRIELRRGYGMNREEKMLSLLCACDEETGMWILLGGRSELQRNSCSGVWPLDRDFSLFKEAVWLHPILPIHSLG